MLKKTEDHTPLYVRLSNIIKERINEKTYQEGCSIPSEMALQREFSVSRTTVRKALKLLTDQSTLIKLPGKGTFVSNKNNDIQTKNHRFSSLTASVEKAGKKLSSRLISINEVKGTTEQREFFSLPGEQNLTEIRRLRYIDGVPFCLEWIWLPPKYSSIENNDLDFPLYKLLKQKFSVSPSTGTKTFKIVFANHEESFLLNVDESTPLMKINDFVYDEKGFPMHISLQILRSDKVTYAVDR